MTKKHTGSLDDIVRAKFNRSARDLLHEYKEKDMSCREVACELSVSICTIRKWSRKFNLTLKPSTKDNHTSELNELFRNPNLNEYNFLSRPWTRA